jgi:hypothetical protein
MMVVLITRGSAFSKKGPRGEVLITHSRPASVVDPSEETTPEVVVETV